MQVELLQIKLGLVRLEKVEKAVCFKVIAVDHIRPDIKCTLVCIKKRDNEGFVFVFLLANTVAELICIIVNNLLMLTMYYEYFAVPCLFR
jgi:hypothetical protein